MLVVVQFPISDGRPFLSGSGSRLDLPDWPTPSTEINPQFVRYFGPAVRRRRGSGGWIDERVFCRADRAIRFIELGRSHFTVSNVLPSISSAQRSFISDGDVPDPRYRLTATPICAFRRLMSDGVAVARVEIGLSCKSGRWNGSETYGGSGTSGVGWVGLLSVVREFLHLSTTVEVPPGGSVESPLMLQGSRLARLYGQATTRFREASQARGDLVEGGAPLVIAQFDDALLPGLPKSAHAIDPGKVHGASVAYVWLRTEKGTIGAWLLGYGTASAQELRSLRVCLLRLHAERQALDLVLKQLRRGRLSIDPENDSSELLQQYLNRATRLLNREVVAGVSQPALLAAFDAAEDVYGATDAQAELSAQLEQARTQVARKVAAYVKQRGQARIVRTVTVNEGGTYVEGNEQIITGGTFMGAVTNQVAAETVQGSFNTVNNSDAPREVKAALIRLQEEVTALIGELEKRGENDKVENAAGLLEAFSQQSVKKRPTKEVLLAAGRGLLDAAKAAADRVTPIAGAVEAVLKLLGVAAP